MAGISGKETKPEITVRKFLFKQGFRYRKNVKSLPGKPDIVLPKYKTVVMIHGCFWHGHSNCNKSSMPKSNVDFWKAKIDSNILRDKKTEVQLKKLEWKVIKVWECQLKNNKSCENTLNKLVLKLKAMYL